MKRSDLALGALLLSVILFFIIPMPPVLLDMMMALNLALSMVILFTAVFSKEALDMSSFPTILLLMTIFRISLNVSSTRMILLEGKAGNVVDTFGAFVGGGNLVVGVIVFIILVLIQFIVINKGSERVAEVSARFTLDAMPGKQMAIDADLSAGLINEAEAKGRRAKIQRESDFYGAMDGATKIVKGDSIMSIIITFVNLIGGFIIGIVQAGMTLQDALSVYSIATVGDGLVSQIPALLISTATGMIVTRSVSEGSLNEDVSGQFKSQPRAIMFTGAVLAVLILIPGMPKLQLGILATVLLLTGYRLMTKMTEVAEAAAAQEMGMLAQPDADAEEPSEEEYYRDINR